MAERYGQAHVQHGMAPLAARLVGCRCEMRAAVVSRFPFFTMQELKNYAAFLVTSATSQESCSMCCVTDGERHETAVYCPCGHRSMHSRHVF